MAATPPTVRHARKLAKDLGLDGVIVIGIAGSGVAGASYGSTKRRCRILGRLLDHFMDSPHEGWRELGDAANDA